MAQHDERDLSRLHEIENTEWRESIDYVLKEQGPDRVRQILRQLQTRAQEEGVSIPFTANTPYINSIPREHEPVFPGDREIERRIKSMVRWNAMAMVVRANRERSGIGGHISTYASAANLWEVGYNHFWRGRTDDFIGDMVFFQGHASPGIYARAFLEGRLTEKDLANFRHELHPDGGLSSYPHPFLMPEFWEYPTVSMGLSAITAIYQARFNHYLVDRGLRGASGRKVWAMLGDGEMDEPESLGAITLAARERLDNLIFVVNCNLQRLDGPVRGNGKIIQELEAAFRGAGWNVIKVIWGSDWDELLEKDDSGLLLQRMEEILDGEMQRYTVSSGAYIREHFFGKYPELLKLVEHYSDEQIQKLRRGGHDPRKVYAAYKAAVEHKGSPTVILAQTIKGYGLGEAGRRQEHHPQPEEAERGRAEGIPHPLQHPRQRRRHRRGALLQAQRGQPRADVPAQAPRRAGRRPARAQGHQPAHRLPDRGAVQGVLRGLGRAGAGHHHGLRPPAVQAAAGQGIRQADRAHRAGRGAHLRHGVPVPPGGHLQPRGPALRPGRQGQPAVLQREEDRRDPGRGPERGRLPGQLHRRGHLLRPQRRQHDPVLRLLLHVRLPAGRRPDLAGLRQPRPGLPDRRDRRPHHPGGRRPAAPGRPQPRAGPGPHAGQGLRPGLRLRAGGDHPRRHHPHVLRRRGLDLLPDGDQRDLRHAAHAQGARGEGGHPQGHVPLPRHQAQGGQGQDPRPPAGLRRHPQRGAQGPGHPRGALRRGRRRVERDQLQGAVPRRHRVRALEPPASRSGAEGALRDLRCSPTRAACSWPPATT